MVAVAMFALYWRTLLPGQDLGDTASFQTTVATGHVPPREGYPLYFAVGMAFARLGHLVGREPAFMLNVASALSGALACGLIAWLGGALSESVVGGVMAGVLLGASYTFWSQAIIAEVYTLHVLFIAATLTALLAWWRRPSLGRLAAAFGLYALSFGNHLSMILLAPGMALFLLAASPAGARAMMRPRVAALAIGCALGGALQYAPLFATLRATAPPDTTLAEALRLFWFDVTKADWRASMVLGIPASELGDRLAMTWFDVRQQFGIGGIGLALAGLAWLLRRRTAFGVMLVAIWIATAAFAFTYNVGDSYVFYIPAHATAALMAAGCGGLVAAAERAVWARRAALVLLLAYPVWRIVDTLPAVDRSDDRRPERALERLTHGLGGAGHVFAADMNWQLQNGLSYYVTWTKPQITVFRAGDVLLYLPFFIRSNLEAGREILASEPSARLMAAAYGPLLTAQPDARVSVPRLSDVIAHVPRGAPYVLCLLQQSPEFPTDRDDVQHAARTLSGVSLHEAAYNVVAGLAGRTPRFIAATGRPFRRTVRLGEMALDLRMDAWLNTDTIRRAGFGHVIANGRHALTIERGVSFVAFDTSGRPIVTAYAGGLFAPQPRYRVSLAQQTR